MQIHGPSQVHSPHGINAPHFSQRLRLAIDAANRRSGPRRDFARRRGSHRAAETGGVRQDLVNLIRNQIASGTYDTPEKMDIAMERLLDQMG